ncbi:2-amino-4-hydroxy-6-hydroxymethyldihydropteridine diphosphokinase [Geosporobacter ferrireducens]|uniref:2-amino-4-hydroxy-6-hydroxymethyldihydropteridine diphosphokinase n=1 Tax=Geosporobacter ferrireducens TaxID=1424294 RepID=A0A1D8GNT9_9FIRM|nr:2-amino-4-hydroxy-6-hydroxymethyldihydropteridine diphosphokinase [Geosporobacter ferrireducens]AOT72600.1 2-amino-4-hydroxy-6-hydroxymethyldihydropteridine diphosphokinase [Geosporobacter ferrireducens]MTI55000.1 2-amino-4-hydroxy-6-hydroxymethyldihydropteridine diphosphokinase [Geosporobacter ferrireducens]
MAKAYLGLGSNIGNRKENIEKALKILEAYKDIQITDVSSYYETDPVGYLEQDCFINIVVGIETSLQPKQLLSCCNEIENELKRKREIRWGPRTLDVDILLYENYLSQEEELTIPHPRMCERSFVMIPLYEIAKDIRIFDQNIRSIVEKLGQEGIRKIDCN